jgi:hypothetical protein
MCQGIASFYLYYCYKIARLFTHYLRLEVHKRHSHRLPNLYAKESRANWEEYNLVLHVSALSCSAKRDAIMPHGLEIQFCEKNSVLFSGKTRLSTACLRKEAVCRLLQLVLRGIFVEY